jgi:hypothetical protein
VETSAQLQDFKEIMLKMSASQTLCLLLAVTVVSLTTTAFTVPMRGTSFRQRTAFASSVYMSDAETKEAETASPPELTVEETTLPFVAVEETAATPVVEDTTTAAAAAAQLEWTAEEKAAKRKVQRERHTLFVGNLPFGAFVILDDPVLPNRVFAAWIPLPGTFRLWTNHVVVYLLQKHRTCKSRPCLNRTEK